MRTLAKMATTTACLLALSVVGFAQDKTVDELAKESTQKCLDTAGTKPTPQMIKEKVAAAAELVAKDGKLAFTKLEGKDSEYIFAGTYIWIHNLDGVMLHHPIKPKMEGQQLLGLRDSKGKLFFTEMNRIATEKGDGWVDYWWPKPGEKAGSLKVSFVKLVKNGDDSFILGCGVYDMSLEEVEKAAAK